MKKKNSGFTASGPARPEIRPGDIFRDKYGSTITIKTVDDFRVTYIREGYAHPCVSSHMRFESEFTLVSRAFLTMTMRPWLANFEQQIKAALLVASPVPGTRYLVEFDSADLLRATPTERYATYEKGIKNGIMNPNEAREREGMPPREGGDEFSQAWKQEVTISKNSQGGDE